MPDELDASLKKGYDDTQAQSLDDYGIALKIVKVFRELHFVQEISISISESGTFAEENTMPYADGAVEQAMKADGAVTFECGSFITTSLTLIIKAEMSLQMIGEPSIEQIHEAVVNELVGILAKAITESKSLSHIPRGAIVIEDPENPIAIEQSISRNGVTFYATGGLIVTLDNPSSTVFIRGTI